MTAPNLYAVNFSCSVAACKEPDRAMFILAEDIGNGKLAMISRNNRWKIETYQQDDVSHIICITGLCGTHRDERIAELSRQLAETCGLSLKTDGPRPVEACTVCERPMMGSWRPSDGSLRCFLCIRKAIRAAEGNL